MCVPDYEGDSTAKLQRLRKEYQSYVDKGYYADYWGRQIALIDREIARREGLTI